MHHFHGVFGGGGVLLLVVLIVALVLASRGDRGRL
jgi:hypothetical protein